MALFFLGLDDLEQRTPERLLAELASFKAVPLVKCSWCLEARHTTSVKLRDHFRGFVGNNGRLWVAEVTDWATSNTKETPFSID